TVSTPSPPTFIASMITVSPKGDQCTAVSGHQSGHADRRDRGEQGIDEGRGRAAACRDRQGQQRGHDRDQGSEHQQGEPGRGEPRRAPPQIRPVRTLSQREGGAAPRRPRASFCHGISSVLRRPAVASAAQSTSAPARAWVRFDPCLSILAPTPPPRPPTGPLRLTLARVLPRARGLLDRPGVEVIGTDGATEEQLTAVHDAPYIEAVRRASGPDVPAVPDGLISFGIGGDDVPPFPGMHAASARIAGASVTALDAIRSGRSTRAVNIAGGLHHARPGAASGFCVYNDAAIAIRHALDAGEERVMYVDVDVHHGDGVELALWDEPRAVT